MFATIENYNLDKAYKEKGAFMEERRKSDDTLCGMYARKISECEQKLETILGNLDKTMKSMENIAKGISNTVDSHRSELNSLTTRLKDVEHLSQESKAHRQVLASVLAAVFTIMVGVAYDYFNTKAKYLEKLTVIEQNMKDFHGSKSK